MVKVPTPGQMAEFTMVTGNKIKCMVEESSLGLMVVNMKENTSMTRNKAMVSFIGQMVASMMGIGCLESKKVSVSTSMLRVISAMADGKVASVSDG